MCVAFIYNQKIDTEHVSGFSSSLVYFYVICVALKAFGVNSFKNFDVYVDRERVVTKQESL